MSSRPAAGGGRWVDVDPERLSKWISGFRTRHGSVTVSVPPSGEGWLSLVGADGSTATFHLAPGMSLPPLSADASLLDLDRFVASAQEPRVLGLLLARRNAAAIGVADGPDLVASKVETFYVQARTAAGGWSQQRYARRRGNQAAAGVREAADVAARILLPYAGKMAALVCGGDRPTVEAILADKRLTALAELRRGRLLDVAEPRHAVLVDTIPLARAVPIHVVDPVASE
ncbi:acVLRF1 family peptidyl-tRNA hydrolase [Hamadaea sp. NPDC050747]|uniref:acVLRF1 family peptidyl-tRNA hydrolase n=1 Tax=Hamadaea sp. NPDC050747 TaxID=3155789 RepID=UPI00341105CA